MGSSSGGGLTLGVMVVVRSCYSSGGGSGGDGCYSSNSG